MTHVPTQISPADAGAGRQPWPERLGRWLRDHQRLVGRLQWGMVALYLPLVFLPPFLPDTGQGAQVGATFTLFARILLWGIWLPGVLVSVLVLGRLWCGLLCPEGALTAAASRHGRGHAIPRWMKWPGWPFVLFAAVTVYGQMISIYDNPRSVALIFGLTTGSALLVGWLYGKEKRVWCRFLCPMNGLFAMLAKLAPMHYRVDARAWDACSPARARAMRFNCEPMVPVRTMESASPCHMCGRCAGFRDAVRLELRGWGAELSRTPGSPAESLLVIAGLIGLGSAVFWWPHAPWLGALTETLAIERPAPWFLFAAADSGMTMGEGVARLLTLAVLAITLSAVVALPLAVADRGKGRFHRLALTLLPLAAGGLIAGFARSAWAFLPPHAAPFDARLVWSGLLLASAVWSLGLARRLSGGAMRAIGAALVIPVAGWLLVIWS
ncbi:4Fe-4S binding protein [Cereibacter azotoformans]|uniref:4Fe-4S binding protein n=1 Tax=Cereibacter azotoformans TaxID=43057 RepID=UPI003B213E21